MDLGGIVAKSILLFEWYPNGFESYFEWFLDSLYHSVVSNGIFNYR